MVPTIRVVRGEMPNADETRIAGLLRGLKASMSPGRDVVTVTDSYN